VGRTDVTTLALLASLPRCGCRPVTSAFVQPNGYVAASQRFSTGRSLNTRLVMTQFVCPFFLCPPRYLLHKELCQLVETCSHVWWMQATFGGCQQCLVDASHWWKMNVGVAERVRLSPLLLVSVVPEARTAVVSQTNIALPPKRGRDGQVTIWPKNGARAGSLATCENWLVGGIPCELWWSQWLATAPGP
jgi:hypothetical protein